jgi:hypothetical protein
VSQKPPQNACGDWTFNDVVAHLNEGKHDLGSAKMN